MFTLAAIALVSTAVAEEPVFAGTETPGQKFEKPEFHLSAEVGGAITTGNTMTRTFNGGVDGSYRWKRNRLTLDTGLNFGQSVPDANADGVLDATERKAAAYEKNAGRYSADLRYDRFLGERDSLYILVGAFSDTFAGYESRVHEQLGYSRILVDSEKVDLAAEIGFDVAQENYVAPEDGTEVPDELIFAAKALVALDWKINESIGFSDKVEVYENVEILEDFRLLNTATFSAKLAERFSLKLSHALAFDNLPPGDLPRKDETSAGNQSPYAKVDQTTLITFVATVL